VSPPTPSELAKLCKSTGALAGRGERLRLRQFEQLRKGPTLLTPKGGLPAPIEIHRAISTLP
jgi:hypothetical protein